MGSNSIVQVVRSSISDAFPTLQDDKKEDKFIILVFTLKLECHSLVYMWAFIVSLEVLSLNAGLTYTL